MNARGLDGGESRILRKAAGGPLTEPARLAREIRAHALCMAHRAGASHIGSCLSIADILAVLYLRVLRFDPSRPAWEDRDRFILSKGHASAALYAVLSECGFFPAGLLESFCRDGSLLAGHASHSVPGVEFSTGSLGHGLSVGAGMALAGTRGGLSYRVFVMLGDGEMNEGSVWEAVLFASRHGLDNIVAIVDLNGLQGFGRTEDVLGLSPLSEKFRSFGWAVRGVDGHDLGQTERAFGCVPFRPGAPSAVIARTVKGKGVSFMQDSLVWHYRSPDKRELEAALRELGVFG